MRDFIGYTHNGKVVAQLPDDFYATEYYADFILEQLQRDQAAGQPFFAYLAFTAPHWPFQVKDEHIDLYKGEYDAGYEIIRARRIAKAQQLGILPTHVLAAPTDKQVVPWSKLDFDEKKVPTKSMEIYAALVERMDYHLGRVLDYLTDSGELDNTIVVFLSDNGASGKDYLNVPAHAK